MILAGQGSFSTIERAPQIRNHSDSSLAVCISSGVRTAGAITTGRSWSAPFGKYKC